MAPIPPALTTWKRGCYLSRPCLDPGIRACYPGPHYIPATSGRCFPDWYRDSKRGLVLDEDHAEDLPRFWTLSTVQTEPEDTG